MSLERVSTATQAKSLAWGLSERQIDVVAALGAAQAREPFPAQVARLMAGDPHAFRAVQQTLWRKFMRKRVLTGSDMHDISIAIQWWLRPACGDCVTGKPPMVDAPLLHDHDCSTCNGTGKRPHTIRTQVYSKTLSYLESAATWCALEVDSKVGA